MRRCGPTAPGVNVVIDLGQCVADLVRCGPARSPAGSMVRAREQAHPVAARRQPQIGRATSWVSISDEAEVTSTQLIQREGGISSGLVFSAGYDLVDSAAFERSAPPSQNSSEPHCSYRIDTDNHPLMPRFSARTRACSPPFARPQGGPALTSVAARAPPWSGLSGDGTQCGRGLGADPPFSARLLGCWARGSGADPLRDRRWMSRCLIPVGRRRRTGPPRCKAAPGVPRN